MISDQCHLVESPTTSAELNVVSGFRHFLQVLDDVPTSRDLRDSVESAADEVLILERLIALLKQPHDGGLEHPHDVAMAIYLWVLSQKGCKSLEPIIEALTNRTDCWWSRKLAQSLLAPPLQSPPTENTPLLSLQPDHGFLTRN